MGMDVKVLRIPDLFFPFASRRIEATMTEKRKVFKSMIGINK